MICFYELSVMTRAVYGICIMLLAVIAVFLLIVSFILDMERWYRLAAAILVIGVMYVFQGISDVSCNLEKGNPLSFFSRIIGNLSSVKVLALLILAAGIEIIFILILYHSKKNVLTSGGKSGCLAGRSLLFRYGWSASSCEYANAENQRRIVPHRDIEC